MIAPARVAAYQILRAVSSRGADLPAAIASARGRLEDDRDRALAAEIATGVQRWRAALDHIIAAFSNRPIGRLDSEVVEILRLSTYQLLHLSRVPASAVVDDGVKLVRHVGKASAAGFVNAVLRAVSRKRHSLPLPERPADGTDRDAAITYLSVTLSHPRWLVTRWLDRLGFEATEAWLQFNNTPAPLTLRVNTLQSSRDALSARLEAAGVRVRPGAYAPDALVVEQGNPLEDPDLDAGWFVVQDEASQLVAVAASPHRGQRVLDACASPGGKATAYAGEMGGQGLVVASDVRERRIDLLRRTVEASGASNIRIVRANLLDHVPFRPVFDLVVVDAPCSGLGTLRRDPDIRWRREESDLVRLAAAELTMVQHAAEGVAPGGRLVYSTCSSEPEENDAVADAFLQTTRDFEPVDLRAGAPRLPRTVIDPRGRLRTEPHVHGLEAFFAAQFRRTG